MSLPRRLSRALPRTSVLAACALATAALAGCAGSGPIAEADRVADATFDGAYAVSMAPRERGFQNVGNWRMNCATGGFELPVRVHDGLARVTAPNFGGAKNPTAPVESVVDARGRFRFEVPLQGRASATGTSASTLDNGAMTLIYTGTLSPDGPSKGRYTVGIAEFGNQGCSYATRIEPVGAKA